MRGWLLAIFAIASIAVGCSDGHKPPVGKWQGVYTGDDAIIVARVEVQSNGQVRVTAPDAFADYTQMTEADKLFVEQNLRANLAASWPKVAPRKFDFDGHVFRNPGGVAPQLEWNSSTHHMTMHVYQGGAQPTIHIDLEPVKQFSN